MISNCKIRIIVKISSTIDVHNANSLTFFEISLSSPLIKSEIDAPINGVIIIDDNIGNETKQNLSKTYKN